MARAHWRGDPTPATAAVYGRVLAGGPATRADLAAATGLAGVTISRALETLKENGLVRDAGAANRGRGRPGGVVEAVTETSLAVGIDVGAAWTRTVVTDLLARRLAERRQSTPVGLSGERLARWLADEATAIAEEAGATAPKVANHGSGPARASVDSVGLGLPGAVRPDTEVVFDAPNLPAVTALGFSARLRAELSDRLRPASVVIDNDANMAVLAEQRLGAARGAATAILFSIGAGLGGGVCLDSRVVTGRTGMVGEFGHLPVGPFGTPLEHMVTGPGILRRADELGVRLSSPTDVFAPDAAGPVVELRRRVQDALTLMLTAAAVSYEPDVIVLSGGIGASLGPLLPELGDALAARLREPPRLTLADLSDMSGALGAAIAALRETYLTLGLRPEDVAELPPAV